MSPLRFRFGSGRRSGSGTGGATGPISNRAAGMSPGCMAGFFAVFLFAGLLFLVPFFLLPAWKMVQARSWDAVPCTILESHVETHAGDDGDTYSVEVRFSYQVDGRAYTGERYNLLGGSSSGFDGKREIVDALPSGTETTCWVDPDDPREAVLDRNPSAMLLFALFPLVFVAIGAGGIAYSLRRPRGRGRHPRKRAEWLPEASTEPADFETGPAGSVVIEPTAGPVGKLIGITLIAIFWNGIVGLFVWKIVESWRAGSPDGCVTIFIVPFLLVGLVLLVLIPYQLLALFNPRPTLTLARGTLPLGGTVELGWRFSGAVGRLESLKITLEGREEATYRRGTSTYTDRETFATLEVVERPRGASLALGSAAVSLPADTLHSFEATNNRVRWVLKLHAPIRRWPDVADEFPVTVTPADGAAGWSLPTAGAPEDSSSEPARPLPETPPEGAGTEPHLALSLGDAKGVYAPGEEVTGTASWFLPEAPAKVEVRLFWYTQGKGDQDVGVVGSASFDPPSAAGQGDFRLRLPAGPYSFSGKLISLTWALELVAEPSFEAWTARREIVVSPTGREVRLETGADTPA